MSGVKTQYRCIDTGRPNSTPFYPRIMEIDPRSYDPGDDESYLSEQQEEAEIERIIEQHGDCITAMVSEIHLKLLPNASTTEMMA